MPILLKQKSLQFVTLSNLALSMILNGCAKPSGNQDGKPKAISPMPFDKKDDKKASVNSIPEIKPIVWKSKLPKDLQAFVPLDLEAGFALGKYEGTFKQERCDSGVVFTTTIGKTKIIKTYTLYDDKECKKIIEVAESIFNVKAASQETIDLEHISESKTLFREADLELANDEINPMCAVGWPELGKSRDISNVGTCKLEPPLFTILVLLGDTIRWGSSSSTTNSNIMDGSTIEKRHVIVEELPYLKVPK